MFIETFLLFWFPEHALKFSKHTFDSLCISLRLDVTVAAVNNDIPLPAAQLPLPHTALV
jgi:hypothetical protein